MAFARLHDCAKATPLLERAEAARHLPSAAVALADCYAAAGDLLRASEILELVGAEAPARTWSRADYRAATNAKTKAAQILARLGRLRVKPAAPYEGLEISIDGDPFLDRFEERRLRPNVSVTVTARARGYHELTLRLVLREGEHRVVDVRLVPISAPTPTPSSTALTTTPAYWLGARYYGTVIPSFLVNTMVDGLGTVLTPGGAVTLTKAMRHTDLTFAVGYLSLGKSETLVKPHGEPDTEWEFISSTLGGLTATVDLTWRFPIDSAAHWSFRLGGAVGAGWMFGDLYRTQAYPKNGPPQDPVSYVKCLGPNNPAGTFRYCNALDKDATHYNGFTEPDWAHGGIRPSLFPWVVLPQIGFTWKPAPKLAVDLDTGLSVGGILVSLGARFGL